MKNSRLAVFLLLYLLTGCASPARNQVTVEKSMGSSDLVMQAPAQPMGGVAEELARSNTSGSLLSTEGENADSSAANRLVVKTAQISIIVPDPSVSMDAISKLAAEKDGWVVSSNLYKVTNNEGQEIPQAAISIRVPADQLDDSMQAIKNLTKNPSQDVQSENVSGQDVTSQYTDLQSRLTNLEQAEASLREIMASARKTEDVLTVFNQLTEIRSQIEVLKGQMKYYEESSTYSSISVSLISQATVKPVTVGGWQPQGVARDAVQALINFGKFLANAVIWIVILGIPLGLVVFLCVKLAAWIIKKIFPHKNKDQIVATEEIKQ